MNRCPLLRARQRVTKSDRERRRIQNDLRQWMRDGDFSPSSDSKGEAIRQRLIKNVLGHDTLVLEVVRLEQAEMDQLHCNALILNHKFDRQRYIEQLESQRRQLQGERLNLEYELGMLHYDAPSVIGSIRRREEIEVIERRIESVEQKISEFQMGVLR